jgi:glucose/arabinose dehydrogenase
VIVMRRRNVAVLLPLLFVLLLGLGGCFALRSSEGGGQTEFEQPRQIDSADVALLEGYSIQAVATGLTFPTGVAFDDQGQVYVTEAGYSYGEAFAVPRLLRVGPDGTLWPVASGENPPWNGVDYADGAFYVAEGGVLEGGRILRVGMDGSIKPLIEDLPSQGDHHTNGPVVKEGWVYFGQGAVTNSSVVGLDSYEFGWLERFPELHDTPCKDINLAGENYRTKNPLTNDPDDTAVTGTFMPFGVAAQSGQVVPGAVPCNGAIMRVPINGGEPELIAWGFRNPFGLAFHPDGRLYVTDNMYDVRGSRPVFGTGDLLWRVKEGRWYGWPDFHGSRPLTDSDQYQAPGEPAPGFVLAEHPGVPPDPAAVLGVHSSSNGLDFSRNPDFGFVGQAFIAQFGDMAPDVGKVLAPVGFKVIRVDVDTGLTNDFAINKKPGGPASKTGSKGLERPVAVRFDPQGSALYVVDFGVMLINEEGPRPVPGTGVLWRITKESSQ